MRERETLKTYSNRYWEIFNEIDGDFDDVVINTFKVGLLAEHGLRKSLTVKLSPVCANLLTELISIREWRKTNNKGLNLRPEDLTTYDSPLVSFDGKVVISRGQIRLPIQTGSKVVDAYSPYTVILARPYLHTLGAVSSTLYQKVKYPSEG